MSDMYSIVHAKYISGNDFPVTIETLNQISVELVPSLSEVVSNSSCSVHAITVRHRAAIRIRNVTKGANIAPTLAATEVTPNPLLHTSVGNSSLV